MIADHDTNIVYISALLSKDFPDVADALKAALGTALRTIPGTKAIWCRDYMPIQLDTDRFIQFQYDPDYLKDDPDLRTKDAASLLDLTKKAAPSKLVIDGGNIVRWKDTAISVNERADRIVKPVERLVDRTGAHATIFGVENETVTVHDSMGILGLRNSEQTIHRLSFLLRGSSAQTETPAWAPCLVLCRAVNGRALPRTS